MLTKLEVRNNRGNLLTLPMEDVQTGYLIQDIGGLGPVKATLVSSSFAQLDGEQYHSSRREARNITIRLALEPDYRTGSIQAQRMQLYNFFMTKSEVQLTFFMLGQPAVNISGRVETCEPAMFVQEPAVDISVMCFDPDFYDPTPVIVNGTSTAGATETLVTYDGSIETGLLFTLNVNRTLTEFTIYHRLPNNVLRIMDFSVPLMNADVVEVSTVRGVKGATLTRSGTNSSILYSLSNQSGWIELANGENYIRVYATGAGIPYTLEYLNKYGGL